MAQVDEYFVRQFADSVMQKAQQEGSRLRRAVNVQAVTGEQFTVEQLEATSLMEETTRHAPTPIVDPDHERRHGFPRPFSRAIALDRPDQVRMLVDPMNAYSESLAMAAGRTIDERIIDAFDGDAASGKNGTTPIPFPAANTLGPFAALDYDALRQAQKFLLQGNENPNKRWYCAISAQQNEDMLGATEATSRDFVGGVVVENGQLRNMLGFEFIHTELLQFNTAETERKVVCWVEDAMVLGVNIEPEARISERDDLSYATQVFWRTMIGAVRKRETGVVVLECAETP